MKSVQGNHFTNFTLQLMEKAARLQVLSPVKRVVFPFQGQIYNNLITNVRSQRNYLTLGAFTW